jgi:hypothetical protein
MKENGGSNGIPEKHGEQVLFIDISYNILAALNVH